MLTQIAANLANTIYWFEEETYDFNPDDVTPGVIGFVATAVFALAVIFLGLALYRRIRRLNYRLQVQEDIAREIAQKQNETTPGTGEKPVAGEEPLAGEEASEAGDAGSGDAGSGDAGSGDAI